MLSVTLIHKPQCSNPNSSQFNTAQCWLERLNWGTKKKHLHMWGWKHANPNESRIFSATLFFQSIFFPSSLPRLTWCGLQVSIPMCVHVFSELQFGLLGCVRFLPSTLLLLSLLLQLYLFCCPGWLLRSSLSCLQFLIKWRAIFVIFFNSKSFFQFSVLLLICFCHLMCFCNTKKIGHHDYLTYR